MTYRPFLPAAKVIGALGVVFLLAAAARIPVDPPACRGDLVTSEGVAMIGATGPEMRATMRCEALVELRDRFGPYAYLIRP